MEHYFNQKIKIIKIKDLIKKYYALKKKQEKVNKYKYEITICNTLASHFLDVAYLFIYLLSRLWSV